LVFFLFGMFPLINLILFAANCGTVALVTRDAVAAAACSANYGLALTAMQNSINHDLSGGFGKFSKLTPNGGYNNTGVDLYIVATALAGGAQTVYGPDTVLPTAPDTTNYIYEYQVIGNYTLQPFVNMSSVPFIGSVPVVGAATPFTYTSQRAVEDSTGLGTLTVLPMPGGSTAIGSALFPSGPNADRPLLLAGDDAAASWRLLGSIPVASPWRTIINRA